MIEMDLTGKVAVVTGAGRGIGRGIALRLALAGSTVVCADLDAASAAETASLSSGGDAYAAQLDVTSASDVDRVLSEVIARNGQLDVLVNNAGINRDAMLHKMTDDQWQQVINVDLTGVFNMMRAASVLMRQAGSGRIVNISSASWMGNIGQANYSAAKAGVVGLTRTAARELARYQVTANAI
jgi:3-oxoacyl-[acyl-carrier protein] reductase/2-hydroxycyclohexanecarboxyl-CoA dehydrogenase